MVDYSIDEDFDLHFNEWDDFAVVDGIDEFEQDVVVTLHYEMRNIINSPSSTARQKIRHAVNRTAKEYNVIENIASIEITNPIDSPDTFAVNIIYETGGQFQETI